MSVPTMDLPANSSTPTLSSSSASPLNTVAAPPVVPLPPTAPVSSSVAARAATSATLVPFRFAPPSIPAQPRQQSNPQSAAPQPPPLAVPDTSTVVPPPQIHVAPPVPPPQGSRLHNSRPAPDPSQWAGLSPPLSAMPGYIPGRGMPMTAMPGFSTFLMDTFKPHYHYHHTGSHSHSTHVTHPHVATAAAAAAPPHPSAIYRPTSSSLSLRSPSLLPPTEQELMAMGQRPPVSSQSAPRPGAGAQSVSTHHLQPPPPVSHTTHCPAPTRGLSSATSATATPATAIQGGPEPPTSRSSKHRHHHSSSHHRHHHHHHHSGSKPSTSLPQESYTCNEQVERRILYLLGKIRENEEQLKVVTESRNRAVRIKTVVDSDLMHSTILPRKNAFQYMDRTSVFRNVFKSCPATSIGRSTTEHWTISFILCLMLGSLGLFYGLLVLLPLLSAFWLQMPLCRTQSVFRDICLFEPATIRGCNASSRALCCAANPASGFWTGDRCKECVSGWKGRRCLERCDDWRDCGGRGVCGVAGRCVCRSGWVGAQCEIRALEAQRREEIRTAFLESWRAYQRHAFGHDVLNPISKSFRDWVPNGFGLTLIDSLDGLFMIGAYDEFVEAKKWVREQLTFDIDAYVSVFETTIRVLGGLLSAYALDNDWLFVERAVELANRLLPAFRSGTGIPYSLVNLRTGHPKNHDWSPSNAILAEFGSIQLEFRYLSHLTRDKRYDEVVTQVMDRMEAEMPADGLYPLYYHNNHGNFDHRQISFGALGDSFYEYLLKQYLLTGRQESRYHGMYNASLRGMINHLLIQTPQWTFLAERQDGSLNHKMDHLACFVPGMLALGAGSDREILGIAERLAYTCSEMYARSPTGISPESVSFSNTSMSPHTRYYILRPEVVESLFYLWRTTKQSKYRDWGWKIFEAVQKHCRVPGGGGYSGLRDVTQIPVVHNDKMNSFWLAETLKYFMLLFSDDSMLNLNENVLNTEGHPIPVFQPLVWN